MKGHIQQNLDFSNSSLQTGTSGESKRNGKNRLTFAPSHPSPADRLKRPRNPELHLALGGLLNTSQGRQGGSSSGSRASIWLRPQEKTKIFPVVMNSFRNQPGDSNAAMPDPTWVSKLGVFGPSGNSCVYRRRGEFCKDTGPGDVSV